MGFPSCFNGEVIVTKGDKEIRIFPLYKRENGDWCRQVKRSEMGILWTESHCKVKMIRAWFFIGVHLLLPVSEI